ncbi:MAG: Fe3+/spermidine/putrescine transporter ATP-binding protein, partial [Actinotalea sp.]|nr:Fe3+/spermidine/putrescine transporter ATP-binding protein [Actinotalea sp.]
QRQRVAMGRAIVRQPRVLLMDEPLSNLDAKLRERMRRDLKLLHHRLGITSLFVTHDQVEALSMSDRIGVMNAGKIVQEGTPEEVYHAPANEFVATFIGSTNLIRGTVVDVSGNLVRVDTPLGLTVGTAVQRPSVGEPASISIRPEDLIVKAADDRFSDSTPSGVNRLSGRVRVSMFAGSYAEYEIDVNGVELSARSGSREPFPRHSDVTVELPVAAIRVFSGEGLGDIQETKRLAEGDEDALPTHPEPSVAGRA